MTNETHTGPGEGRPSRSEQKRAAQAIHRLAEHLVALSPARVAKAGLPDELQREIARTRSFKAHGAHKRQLGFLAKLMRRLDETELASLRALVDGQLPQAAKPAAAERPAETLCRSLIEGGDAELGSLLDRHPALDRQHLRNLLRQARREHARGKSGQAVRKLVVFLEGLPNGQGR